MRSSTKLDESERECLSEVVESSLRVINRHQFFSWTQGAMQRLISHEILICGVEDGSRRGLEHYHFEATRYFRENHFEAVCRPETGLLKHLVLLAEQSKDSVVLCPSTYPARTEVYESLRALVEENELRNLAAFLWIGPRSALQAYYSFSRVEALTERTGYFLELLVPFIHSTFLRVLAHHEIAETSNGSRSGRLVTPRQEEILQLIRDGKTNGQIAAILKLSPWTIKNHVQMIFQRLDSANRAQAITRAISLGILRAD